MYKRNIAYSTRNQIPRYRESCLDIVIIMYLMFVGAIQLFLLRCSPWQPTQARFYCEADVPLDNLLRLGSTVRQMFPLTTYSGSVLLWGRCSPWQPTRARFYCEADVPLDKRSLEVYHHTHTSTKPNRLFVSYMWLWVFNVRLT